MIEGKRYLSYIYIFFGSSSEVLTDHILEAEYDFELGVGEITFQEAAQRSTTVEGAQQSCKPNECNQAFVTLFTMMRKFTYNGKLLANLQALGVIYSTE